jgi:hypothetical protein
MPSINFNGPTIQRFTSNVGTQSGILFTVTAANATVGATYTNNSQTFTVLSTISGGTTLFTSNTTGLPLASGTLTRTSGTGDATITFSRYQVLLTYTRPTGVKYLKVKMAGGGGGGATAPVSGGNGTETTFGTFLLRANGGSGATANINGVIPGLGATIGTVNSPAISLCNYAGMNGISGARATTDYGGAGGSTPFGGAGSFINGTAYAGVANTGSGGSGNNGGGAGSGGGAGGYIEALISNPSTTYFYSVGSGGTSSAGAGGSGVIIVEEYYS